MMSRTSIDEWKTTPWVEIDVENMDMECKKFAKVSNLDDQIQDSEKIILGPAWF